MKAFKLVIGVVVVAAIGLVMAPSPALAQDPDGRVDLKRV